MLAISTAFVLALIHVARVYGLSPQDLAASYNLTSTSALVFPPSPIDNTGAANYIVNNSNWNVPRITENPQDVAFVADPFPNASPNVQNSNASPSNASATVLQVNYPQGSFSHDTGGVQFSNIYDESGTAGYQTMVLTYEVAFDQNFQFVKGYAYIPAPNGLCRDKGIMCNDDGFGISIDRATFGFTPGKWTRITMLISLNDPTYANGVLLLYYNDLLAIKQENLYYRAGMAINNVQGMFFSTFFGGNDNSWASPVSQNTYYRNIQLWAGTAESNVTGQRVTSLNSAPSLRASCTSLWATAGIAVVAGLMTLL